MFHVYLKLGVSVPVSIIMKEMSEFVSCFVHT